MEVTAGLPSVTLQGMTSVVPSTGFCVSKGCIEGGSFKIEKKIKLLQNNMCIFYID